MNRAGLPTHLALMNPVVKAIQGLGGSGTNDEIDDRVAEIMGFSDEELAIPHNPQKGGMTEIEYRLAWSRTYLKIAGILENSSRGVWSLTHEGNRVGHLDEKEVVRLVRRRSKEGGQEPSSEIDRPDSVDAWRGELMDSLLKLAPQAFERLIQRLLREAGFTQVEVIGRSGDGGIDGKGIIRLGGMLSFHVIFQCKRWQGTIGPSQVRDFRGAMVGRADKGLLVTTGSFSKDAVREATRDGTPAIDLIDGELLLDKLKALSLGVRTQKVELEQVSVDRDWFAGV